MKAAVCVNRAMFVFFSLNTNKLILKMCFENHLHAPKQDRLKGKLWNEIGIQNE